MFLLCMIMLFELPLLHSVLVASSCMSLDMYFAIISICDVDLFINSSCASMAFSVHKTSELVSSGSNPPRALTVVPDAAVAVAVAAAAAAAVAAAYCLLQH